MLLVGHSRRGSSTQTPDAARLFNDGLAARGSARPARPQGREDRGADQTVGEQGQGDTEFAVAARQVPERAGGVQSRQSETRRAQQQRGAQAQETEGRHFGRASERGLDFGTQQTDLSHHLQGRKVHISISFINHSPIDN